YDALSRMGVTHLLWERGTSRATDSLAGDLRFFGLAFRHSHPREVEYLMLAEMPASPPPEGREAAAVLACEGMYDPGLYELEDLRMLPGPRSLVEFPPPREPLLDRTEAATDALVARADFLVLDPRCHPPTERTRREFTMAARRGALEEWI